MIVWRQKYNLNSELDKFFTNILHFEKFEFFTLHSSKGDNETPSINENIY